MINGNTRQTSQTPNVLDSSAELNVTLGYGHCKAQRERKLEPAVGITSRGLGSTSEYTDLCIRIIKNHDDVNSLGHLTTRQRRTVESTSTH
jgi:hypothetical protein